MKKLIFATLAISIGLFLPACKKKNKDNPEEFKPSMDKKTSCSIKIVGSYGNFEALETEFDRFNEYYPNVTLSYLKLDDYNNTLSTVLESNDKPNIFFSYTWMIGNDKYNSVVSHMENLSSSNLKINLDCIRPGLINHDSEGNVLMVPVFSRSYGMLVNNDLFKKEKVEIPTKLDELLSCCTTLNGRGYKSPMMGYTQKSSSCLMNTVAYPLFLSELANNKEALDLANNLDPKAGVYMRNSLEKVDALIKNNCIDISECDKIKDNYESVIMRFFEGDVPMMICTADTASGTKKRESQSEAYTKNPFNYSFYSIPLIDNGGYFIDSPSIEFSVNKDCDNLDMTNEFMRFLVTNKELNEMASNKGLLTPTKAVSFDSIYASFGNIPQEYTISPEALGIKDQLTVQIRVASFKVGKGELTIDEAIEKYGTYE